MIYSFNFLYTKLNVAHITYVCFLKLLTPLQEIEKAHYKLLETLRESSISQDSEDQQCRSATVSRTPSLDRSSGDGEHALNLQLELLHIVGL